MSRRPAFTLVELIVALVLSTFVLVAIVGVTSQMLRYEFEGSRKASSTNWSLLAHNAIKKDVGGASAIFCPSVCAGVNNPPGCGGATGCGTVQSNYLSGCGNYSFQPYYPAAAGPTDGADKVTSFYYCVQTAGTPSGDPWLWRYSQGPGSATCPHPAPGSCGGASAGSRVEVVAQDFYPYAANTWYFRREASGGVEAQFTVGIGTTSVPGKQNTAVPTAQHIGMKVSMNKSFGNSLD
jgi:hypothetical protein